MKKSLLILFLLLNSFSVFGTEFLFSVEPQISYNNEQLSYSIYDGTKLNSELDWNSSFLFKSGSAFQFEFNKIILRTLFLFNLPLKNGKMYDSDYYTDGVKTNLSIGDLYTDFGFDSNLQIQYKFSLPNNFFVSPLISLNYSYIQLQCKNNIGFCGDTSHTDLLDDVPWDSENAKRVNKYGIDLNTNITSICLGTQIKKIIHDFHVGLTTYFAPFTYISSLDHHNNAEGGRYYLLIQQGFFSEFAVSLGVGYFINNHNSINLSLNSSFCPGINGIFYFGQEKDDDMIADQTCKFEFYKFAINFLWKISF